MLLFNVIESPTTSSSGTLVRINDKTEEFADPRCTDFTNLLIIKTDRKAPVPGISGFNTWSALRGTEVRWNDKDWIADSFQPIENGESCFVLLIGREGKKNETDI